MNFKEREKYNIFHIYKVKGIYRKNLKKQKKYFYRFIEKK
jgi:hypothetical protein